MLSMIALIIWVYVSTFGLGFFWIRKLSWPDLEKLACSLALGLLITYSASCVIYGCRLPIYTHHLIAMLGLLGLAASWNPFKKLFSNTQIQKTCCWFGIFLLWVLGAIMLIRNYSGGGWTRDWICHYDRTLFFLEHWDTHISLFDMGAIPARPPLLNLLCAHFMALVGSDFGFFQASCAFLNLFFFFSAVLFFSGFGRKQSAPVFLIAGAFMLNPLVFQNSIYAWPRLLTVFFVLLGLWLYRQGWLAKDRLKIIFAFLSISLGILTHYSAGPYAVFLALHYLIGVFPKRKHRWRELGWIVLINAIILSSWFVWSYVVYGSQETFFSNTTAGDYQQGSFLRGLFVIAVNLYATIVPHFLRTIDSAFWYQQGNFSGYLRDVAFLTYQTNLLFAFGSAGAGLIVYQLFRQKKDPFWVLLLGVGIFLSIAAMGRVDPFGSAHVCLQPLVVLGLVFLARHFFSWPRWAKALAILGGAVDLILGIGIHLRLLHMEFGPAVLVDGLFKVKVSDQLSLATYQNWVDKQKNGFVFLGDTFFSYSGLVTLLMGALLIFFLTQLYKALRQKTV